MPKKSTKSLSKRTTLRKKYKAIKKVAEHHKKARKAARKLGIGKRKKNPLKDPGIPRELPLSMRQDFVKEVEFERLRQLARNKAKKSDEVPEQVAAAISGGAKMMELDDKMDQLQAQANVQEKEFEERMELSTKDDNAMLPMKGVDNSRRAFYREFKKVVDLSDVIIQVLDARDPISCRCLDVERYVRSINPNKKVFLLLNKIDLIPAEVCEQWLKYFREEIPCVAFKCSTQKQSANLGHRPSSTANKSISECLGGDTLLQLLKNYSRSGDMKRAITVGVVGIPNVGKSSLINSLKRAKATNVGNKPGVTRNIQEVQLDKNVTLLDSPGIVFQDGAGAVLRNAVAIDKLDDPITPVFQIVERVGKKNLMKMYKISNFEDADGFIRNVAMVRGKLKRGGTPDVQSAAKLVLQDWNDGKLPYYTLPPKRSQPQNTKIVSSWSADFDVDSVYAQEKSTVIAGLPSMEDAEQQFVQITASLSPAQMVTEMDEDEENQNVVNKEQVKPAKSQNAFLYNEQGQYNPAQARALKKKKKKQLDMEVDNDEDFDFDVDWNSNKNIQIEAHPGAYDQLETLDTDNMDQMQ
eukprot:TRINITY_DN12541_c0_g1_i2.p1 TRINITY_DN12541_c0_g1~~TRINITY_DN12541_c0_g1_i2.p1  ORF type:complete len:580 (-),score=92.77 TRINITY_DN12541_c0_g1_i2:322-2061(-)